MIFLILFSIHAILGLAVDAWLFYTLLGYPPSDSRCIWLGLHRLALGILLLWWFVLRVLTLLTLGLLLVVAVAWASEPPGDSVRQLCVALVICPMIISIIFFAVVSLLIYLENNHDKPAQGHHHPLP